MKKLNRNGFTLVELLATVVILSLVTGVAVPVTTNIVATSKYKSLGSIVDEAETFISDQWRIHKIAPDTVNDAFDAAFDNFDTDVLKILYSSENYAEEDCEKELNFDDETQIEKEKLLLSEMGMSIEDVSRVDVYVDTNGIGCVIVRAIPKTSKLYNSKYWSDAGIDGYAIPENNTNDRYYSKCCTKKQIENNSKCSTKK